MAGIIKHPKKLHFMLDNALEKESKSWKEKNLRDTEDDENEISPRLRDEITRWMCMLNFKFKFSPETFMLSTTILDHFLASIKARPKYLKCISVSCFFLAMKMKEEDDVVPSTQELVEVSDCGCSVADVLRMEKIILDKLHWDINMTSSLDFLHNLHALLVFGCPHFLSRLGQMSPSRHLSILTARLLQCVCNNRLTAFRGSVLALALLSLELEILVPDWLAVTMMLQRLIKVDNQQVIHCRETIVSVLMGHPAVNTVYMMQQQQKSDHHGVHKKRKTTIKRKVEQIEVDEIYDSIKRLYNEEAPQDVMMVSAPSTPKSCHRQQQQDSTEGTMNTCPPLQIIEVS
ncbi:cyclin-I-like [Saccoglossus kowalevskii]|uniref:Cyclin-I-like n=1 Tax=Saccoglossus kowalevskii TaxID=10224 RepID=A0ABM0GMQ0_SACKO|nr:PREDICTED: cyclin-I-like [Saccoglossus kowalevskii]